MAQPVKCYEHEDPILDPMHKVSCDGTYLIPLLGRQRRDLTGQPVKPTNGELQDQLKTPFQKPKWRKTG